MILSVFSAMRSAGRTETLCQLGMQLIVAVRDRFREFVARVIEDGGYVMWVCHTSTGLCADELKGDSRS